MDSQTRSDRLIVVRSFYPLTKVPETKDARYIAFLNAMGRTGIDTRYCLTSLKTTGQIGSQKSYEALGITASLQERDLVLAVWAADRWYGQIAQYFPTAEGYFPNPLRKATKIALVNEEDWPQAAIQFTGDECNAGPVVLNYRVLSTGFEDGRILVLPFKASYTDEDTVALSRFMDQNRSHPVRQAKDSTRLPSAAVLQGDTRRYNALTTERTVKRPSESDMRCEHPTLVPPPLPHGGRK